MGSHVHFGNKVSVPINKPPSTVNIRGTEALSGIHA